jgi:N6-adenosine-specific RNA methylase IME4
MTDLQPHELANLLPDMSEHEMNDLVSDMLENGYRAENPIYLFEGKILDGRNRYAAAKVAGVKPTFTEYKGADAWKFVVSQNLHRRHLDETQRAGVASRRANMTGGERTDLQPTANLRKVSVEEAAAEMNVSPRTVTTYRAVAAAMPELVPLMDSGEMTANKAWTETRRRTVIANLEGISAQEAKAIQGVYDVIVVDPPWPMEKIEREVAPNQVAFDYPTMSLEEIENLEIPCADNCHVFLWTTQKFLPFAFGILAAWDMKYVCNFVWHKNGGFQPYNLPQYNCEFALYARKGTPQFVDLKDFMTCFNAPRGAHSEKPEEFYATLRRVTAGRRLDMFNRRTIDGFDGFGKESK